MEGKKRRRALVRDVNPHLICVLCNGYFIEAATIVDCLHSFCRSCLVKYLGKNKFCPICDLQLHKNNPLSSIRCDPTLQKLVYKLIPGLYASEMARRKAYYRELRGGSSDEEQDSYPVHNLYFSPDDSISLSLEFLSNDDDEITSNPEKLSQMHRRYLQCPAAVTMSHLKKFIRMKYDLNPSMTVEIIYDDECLEDDFSLIDVAYTFDWNRNTPMRFKYRIGRKSSGSTLKLKKATVSKAKPTANTGNQRKRGLATVIHQDVSVLKVECTAVSGNTPDQLKQGSTLVEVTSAPAAPAVQTSAAPPDPPPPVVEAPPPAPLQETKRSDQAPETSRPQSPFKKPEKRKCEEPERERKRARTEPTAPSCMDESHDADDEDDEKVARLDDDRIQDRKDHPAKKSERKEKKKSKKAKHHHHHHHHRHHDKKKDPPPAATILHKPGEDVLKLKVKLAAIKTDTNSKVTKYSVVEEFDNRRENKVPEKNAETMKKEESIKENKSKEVPKTETNNVKEVEITKSTAPSTPSNEAKSDNTSVNISQSINVNRSPPQPKSNSNLNRPVNNNNSKNITPAAVNKQPVINNTLNKNANCNGFEKSSSPVVNYDANKKSNAMISNVNLSISKLSGQSVNNNINSKISSENNINNNNNKITPNNNHNGNASPLRSKPEPVKLIAGEAAKEKLLQMRAVRHKAKPAEPQLKMPPSSITVSKITAEEKRQMEQAKLLAAKQAAQDESKRPSLEIMLVNGPPGKEEPPPPPPVKKNVRPPPPSIPLVRLNKNAVARWQAKQPEVLDLSDKSSRKSPDQGDTAMRNLMTLSDTAVHIRNMMHETELKIPLVGCKPAPAYLAPRPPAAKPNQNVRHIPNPSALAFRQYNGGSFPPPPALPLRKMESMTRNIEKVAAGLKAAYAAK